MDASFFSKPLSQLECRDNKKFYHLLEKKGTHPMRMHDNNTTCNRSNQNAGFQTQQIPHAIEAIRMQVFQTHTAVQPISIQPLQIQQKPRVTEARHNAEKHSLFTETQYTPSQDREVTRRKIANGVTELWFYLRSELNKAADRLRAAGGGAGDGVLANLKSVLEDGADMQRYVVRRRDCILQLVTPLTSHLPFRTRIFLSVALSPD